MSSATSAGRRRRQYRRTMLSMTVLAATASARGTLAFATAAGRPAAAAVARRAGFIGVGSAMGGGAPSQLARSFAAAAAAGQYRCVRLGLCKDAHAA